MLGLRCRFAAASSGTAMVIAPSDVRISVMNRTVKTQAQLEEAAKHIKYEIEMLLYAAQQISGWQSSPPTPYGNEANMALECFLLHYRNLRAFLCPSLQRFGANDILASDFLGKSEEADIGDPSKLDRDKTRLDEMLAHVTYSRSTYIEASDYSWNIEKMLILVLDELSKFLGIIPAAQLPWYQNKASLQQARDAALTRLVP
jgi:hypothetical protein